MSSNFFDFLNGPAVSLALNDIGTGVQSGGQFVGALSHIQFGQQQLQAEQFRADQLRQQGGQEIASSQRTAEGIDLNTRYITSAALAAAAGSGGGGSDPGVVTLQAQIAQVGAYKAATALYQGQERSRLLNLQADAAEYSGEIAKSRSEDTGYAQMFGASTTLLKGFAKDASIYERYGMGGPPSVGQ